VLGSTFFPAEGPDVVPDLAILSFYPCSSNVGDGHLFRWAARPCAVNAFFTNAWPASAVRDSDPVCPRLVPQFPRRDNSPRRYIYFRENRSGNAPR
jgi:hypothetical protein